MDINAVDVAEIESLADVLTRIVVYLHSHSGHGPQPGVPLVIDLDRVVSIGPGDFHGPVADEINIRRHQLSIFQGLEVQPSLARV
jgi:hypothetical protein